MLPLLLSITSVTGEVAGSFKLMQNVCVCVCAHAHTCICWRSLWTLSCTTQVALVLAVPGDGEVGEQPFRGHLVYGELAQGHAYSGEVYMHDWSTGVGDGGK